MEFGFIDWLRERLTSPAALGLRDDAAILQTPNSVITTDMLMDGVHFDGAATCGERIGHKSLAASLSDLAAMAARPQGAVVSLAVPRNAGLELGKAVAKGMMDLADRFGVPIIGGDTNTWNGPLVISVAAWGEPIYGSLTRSGGVPGDVLVVTGELGGSLLGHHLDFIPRVEEALELKKLLTLHAGMDITDGLVLDLSRLAEASGCGAILQPHLVPIAASAQSASANDGRSALDHALYDGEDFELLLSMPCDQWDQWEDTRNESESLRDLKLTRVGRLCQASGIFAELADGTQKPLEVAGYVHEAQSPGYVSNEEAS